VGKISCPETSVTKYQSTLRNIPEDRRPHSYIYNSFLNILIIFALTIADVRAHFNITVQYEIDKVKETKRVNF
jgi:hypothetical protein